MAIRKDYLRDDSLSLKVSASVTASAAGTLIRDLQDAESTGVVLIDVTALEIASNNEIYNIVVQYSPDAAFGTAGNIQDGPQLSLSAKEVKTTTSDKDDTIGRYELLTTNVYAGTVYRYMRIYTVVAGTIDTTGITYAATYCPFK